MIISKNGRNVLLEWCLPKTKYIVDFRDRRGNGLPLSYLADKLEAQAFGIEPRKKLFKTGKIRPRLMEEKIQI